MRHQFCIVFGLRLIGICLFVYLLLGRCSWLSLFICCCLFVWMLPPPLFHFRSVSISSSSELSLGYSFLIEWSNFRARLHGVPSLSPPWRHVNYEIQINFKFDEPFREQQHPRLARSENANIGLAWPFQIFQIRFMIHCVIPQNFRPLCAFLPLPNMSNLSGPSLAWKFLKFRWMRKNWPSMAKQRSPSWYCASSHPISGW